MTGLYCLYCNGNMYVYYVDGEDCYFVDFEPSYEELCKYQEWANKDSPNHQKLFDNEREDFKEARKGCCGYGPAHLEIEAKRQLHKED